MFPGINPKDMKKVMKRMGIKQEEIEANEVIIKCADKELIIKNPQVSKINAMGQETLQVTGDIEERSLEEFTEEDVKVVMEKTNCSADEARKVLEKNKGDLAKSILDLSK